jgi:hypothetical protein
MFMSKRRDDNDMTVLLHTYPAVNLPTVTRQLPDSYLKWLPSVPVEKNEWTPELGIRAQSQFKPRLFVCVFMHNDHVRSSFVVLFLVLIWCSFVVGWKVNRLRGPIGRLRISRLFSVRCVDLSLNDDDDDPDESLHKVVHSVSEHANE